MLFVSGREKETKGHWFTQEDLVTINDSVPEGMEYNFTRNLSGRSGLGMPGALYVEPAIPDLPSWASDLSNSGREPCTLPWLNTHGKSWFKAGGGLMTVNPMLPGRLIYLDEDLDENGRPDSIRRIILRGKVVDRVESTAIIHQWESHLPCSPLCYIRSMALVCRQIFRVAIQSSQGRWSFPEDPEMPFARIIVADGSGSVFRSLMKDCIVEDEVDKGKLLSYWNTYDKYWEEKDLDALQECHSFDDIPSPATNPVDLRVVKSYHRCLVETLEGHIFFCTQDRNLLGLPPLPSKFNYTLAVVAGVRTPLVLRHGTASTGKSGYLIVGPCYLSGVMDGSELIVPDDLRGQDLWDHFTPLPLI
ncbi:hypothetical protein K469DRAFT_697341 [Zopfia rhizophila CBS 207.26]|uniref:Heterokaryon incompatibility domain-containing protein n=1 Tax=Zopfia rhizophila CBS 207.26 TaxID=1314779 RepID=A0A6A6DH17_9PEZI|nr:hypothetical protein K469DRAFT_694893 [Zopfia rhizophila CBS 207.26]KAF2177250.1 hypothetical protein K469DRAFT_697341 [Zopfia rhizophila CBS 207.26]